MNSHIRVRAWIAALTAIATMACGDDANSDVGPDELDASRTGDAAASLDGSTLEVDAGPTPGPGDASVMLDSGSIDATVDAALDASGGEACFRPFSIPTAADFQTDLTGCACSESAGSGYCVSHPTMQGNSSNRYEAVVCHEGSWALVNDGPCFPSAPIEASACTDLGGAVVALSAGDGGAATLTCPLGSHLLAGVVDDRACCAPLEVSQTECTAAGYEVVESALDAGLVQGSCPGSRRLRAHIPATGSTQTASCCE